MHKQIVAKIIIQEEVQQGCFRMKLEAPLIAKAARPGQFLHIRCSGSTDPLLRRPISVHRINKNGVEILYNVVGKGTEILSKKKKGDYIDMIGPLGNGFTIYGKSRSLKMLVAGGMGVAPLFALAEELSKYAKGKNKFIALLGAKSKNHVLCADELRKLGGTVYVATEDGSLGRRGLATSLAEEIVKSKDYHWKEICVYAAGPIAMVRALSELVEGCSAESQASLEEKMACGLGACLGCVVDTQRGYKRACKDGPVFNMCDII